MIAEPPIPLRDVCAGLFFRGVLPAFEDYLKFDPVARKIIGSSSGKVLFTNRRGSAACLNFEDGSARWVEGFEEHPTIHIGLGSEANTIRFVRGGFAIPVIQKGWFHPVFLTRLLRLFLRFQSLLMPASKLLEDPAFRILHVRLALAVALFSLAEIGREDPWARRMLEGCPNGTVSFLVDGEDLAARIEKTTHHLVPLRGPASGAISDATVRFASSKVAMEILTQKQDAHAAVALGGIQVEGLIPLADGINHVLDRVTRYLPSG